ncbi:hypothetical protein [Streptomyces decoyicus]
MPPAPNQRRYEHHQRKAYHQTNEHHEHAMRHELSTHHQHHYTPKGHFS